MTAWRIATFNIRHGLGRDGRVDLARTAQEIAALGADVIGLQEVDVAFGPRSGDEDQAARLGELLGMQVAFGPALDLPPARPGAARRRFGLALLTRHGLDAPRTHLLPGPAGPPPPREPRGVLTAHVRRADGEELAVLVTHLDNAAPRHRAAQVQGIVRLTGRLAGPAVLLGDLNADPSAPELAALAGAGWREAAREVGWAGGGAAASPVLRRLGALLPMTGLAGRPTHPARFPLRRIDALWVRDGVTVRSLVTGGRGGSDHRPVLASAHLD